MKRVAGFLCRLFLLLLLVTACGCGFSGGESVTVTFVPDNGQGEETVVVKKGEKLKKPADPEKESDRYAYSFLGWYTGEKLWDFENDKADTDMTLTAKYRENEKDEYTVKWKSGNIVLKMEKVGNGDLPVYTGDEPEKVSEDGTDFFFAGWTPEVTPAKSDITYQAVFEPIEKEKAAVDQYTITFRETDGSVIKSCVVERGQMPVAPSMKDMDYHELLYRFTGWDKTVERASKSTVYTAKRSLIAKNLEYKDGKVVTVNNDMKTAGESRILLADAVKTDFVLHTKVTATDCNYPAVGFSLEDSQGKSVDIYLANLFTRTILRNHTSDVYQTRDMMRNFFDIDGIRKTIDIKMIGYHGSFFLYVNDYFLEILYLRDLNAEFDETDTLKVYLTAWDVSPVGGGRTTKAPLLSFENTYVRNAGEEFLNSFRATCGDITKVFGLEGVPRVYSLGATDHEIVSSFPAEYISVGSTGKIEKQLWQMWGNWVVENRTNEGADVVFKPTVYAPCYDGNNLLTVHITFGTAAPADSFATTDRTVCFNEDLKDKAVVFFGDSITERCRVNVKETDYMKELQKACGFYQYNGGVGGALWACKAGVGTNHAFAQYDKYRALVRDADVVCFFLGTNDWNNAIEIGGIDDTVTNFKKATSLSKAINYILSDLIAVNPDVKIVLITPLFRNLRSGSVMGAAFDASNGKNTLGDVRDCIIAMAKKYGCTAIDTTSVIGLSNQDLYLQYDRLHVTPSGYKALADYILRQQG